MDWQFTWAGHLCRIPALYVSDAGLTLDVLLFLDVYKRQALLLRQHLHKVFEHIGARVAQGVYRMAHAVDQARSVEGFPVQQRCV